MVQAGKNMEKNSAILITGGTRGIGRETAVLCAERGWSVALNYRTDGEEADRAVSAVEAVGGQAIAIKGDVSVEADVVRMFDEAERALGPLSGLVNNAGIVAPSLPLADMPIERLQLMFDTNILGAYLVAREAARRMPISRGGTGGAIVNVSSIAARLGSPGEYVDYAGSKAAVDALTIGLAKELAADGVRVNAVRPGLIDTEIHASGGQPGRAQRLGGGTPIGREGQPEEIAQAIVWLLSDAASYAVGTIMDISGGR